MKTKLNGILTLLLAFFVQVTFAQDRVISGVVSDEAGPLPGVTVMIKNTTQGTETDFDGNYTLRVSEGDVLVFSFVGMKTLEQIVGASDEMSVLLENDNLLEEVIVVGYGKASKESYTGTAKVVEVEKMEAKAVANVSQALVGEVSGVNVINTSGQPGTVATIRIRGFGSVNGNRDPLYVVDGVPLSGAVNSQFSSDREDTSDSNMGTINSINPSDIESLTVLKDATATAIYGSRGANGVVLITTKSGKAGTSSMEVDIKTGVNFQALPRYEVITSADEYLELSWHAMSNRRDFDTNTTLDAVSYANQNLFSSLGIDPRYNYFNTSNVSEIIDPVTGKVRENLSRKYTPENWGDHAFQASIRTEANLKMSGGNETTNYFSSFGYLDDVGYSVNSSFKRYSTRLNISHKPKEWLTAKANIGYTLGKRVRNGQSEDSGSVFWVVDNVPSIYPLFLRDAQGNKVEDTKYGGYQYDYGAGRHFAFGTNSIGNANYNFLGDDRHSLNGNFSFKVDLTDWLEFETLYGAQYYNQVSNDYQNPFYGFARGQRGSLTKDTYSFLSQNLLNIFRVNKSFEDHSFSAFLAYETNSTEYSVNSISKNKIVNLSNGLFEPNNYVVNSFPASGYSTKKSLESFFGQVSYDYLNKYYLSGSLRRDGSSRFANDKWGTFGSIGGSWIVSKEDFLVQSDFLNFLKLKASFGVMGDQEGVDLFSGVNAYDIANLGDEISLTPRTAENPNLTWETSKMYQAGLEFGLFGDKIEGSVDYYLKRTNNLIFKRGEALSTGNEFFNVNDGYLKNSGFEFDITAHLIDKENYSLDFGINGEVIDVVLEEMPIDPSTGDPKVIDIDDDIYGRSKGRGLYDFYLRDWAGVNPQNGSPMWYQYYHDQNNNGIVDEGESISSLYEYQVENPNNKVSRVTTDKYSDATQKYIGKSIVPKVRGAFRLNARLHDFTISTLFGYSLGGHAYDDSYASLMSTRKIGSDNWHVDIKNSWKSNNDQTDVPRLVSNEYRDGNRFSSRFVTSTDYLSLNNVRIGYNVPSSFMGDSGISNLNFWVSGDNLFVISERKGFNPMFSETGRSSVYRYAPLSTLTLGVKVKF